MDSNVIIWATIGGFFGWLAGLLLRTRTGFVVNILVGVVSSFISAVFISPLLDGSQALDGDMSLPALLSALGCTAIVLGMIKLLRPGQPRVVAPDTPASDARFAIQAPAQPAPDSQPSRATPATPPPQLARSGIQAIFISYRREDAADATGRIYDRLVQRFGDDAVFKDVDSIPLGANFQQHLAASIAQCSLLLAVIGRQWLTIEDRAGQRRLSDPRDFVRIELEAAIQRGIPIIPLLVQGATVPPPDQLPAALRELSYRNGTSIRPDPDFHHDMDRLIEAVERYLEQQRARR